MLKKGDKAPDFTLPDENGKPVSLQSLLSEGPLILYFYPSDFTPVCTREACGIRDIHDEIEEVGIQVVGVSPQSEESHQRFRDKYALPFKLLNDRKKQAIKAFGVDGPLGIGVRRATFLISQDGRIENRVVSDLFAGNHIDFVRKVIDEQGKPAE